MNKNFKRETWFGESAWAIRNAYFSLVLVEISDTGCAARIRHEGTGTIAFMRFASKEEAAEWAIKEAALLSVELGKLAISASE